MKYFSAKVVGLYYSNLSYRVCISAKKASIVRPASFSLIVDEVTPDKPKELLA